MTRRHYGFSAARMRRTCAHGGEGLIHTARVEEAPRLGAANFVDLTIVPPGTSIGLHKHGPEDEEVYIIISGNGKMRLDDNEFLVEPGDVIINSRCGSHGLLNTGHDEIRLVVIEIAATRIEES